MYKFNELSNLHIEITANCQASCPMCARNYHGGLENPLLKNSDISLDFFKQICNSDVLNQLDDINLCGNFGDPIVHKDLSDIIKYIVETNPKLRINIHTNGSARTTEWWSDLARALPESHLVYFGIDGLEDTHHLYRTGTSFNKIIENAKAFISAGGRARWNFITFKHNEHQLDAVRQMSKDLGFDSFQEKQTSRFIGNPWYDVLDKDGNVTHRLEQPTEQKLVFIDKKTAENYKEIFGNAKVTCQVEQTKSVYVDAQGHLWPCCFVGATPYLYAAPEEASYNYRNASYDSLQAVIKQFGGLDQLDLRQRSIKDIVDSKEWQTIWDSKFNGNDRLLVCARTCGKYEMPIVSQAFDQFLTLDRFSK